MSHQSENQSPKVFWLHWQSAEADRFSTEITLGRAIVYFPEILYFPSDRAFPPTEGAIAFPCLQS
jgi:hypothetical protein